MFFTELGRFAAGIAFIIGAGAIAFGVKILFGDDIPDEGYALVAIFFSGGGVCVLFAIIIGAFTDISKSLAKGGLPPVGRINTPRIEPLAKVESE